jgi:hypothetical protein
VPRADICSAANYILFDPLVGAGEQHGGRALMISSNLLACTTDRSAMSPKPRAGTPRLSPHRLAFGGRSRELR